MTTDEMIKEMQSSVSMSLQSPDFLAYRDYERVRGWVSNGRWQASCRFYIKRENGAVDYGIDFEAPSFNQLIELIYQEWQNLK